MSSPSSADPCATRSSAAATNDLDFTTDARPDEILAIVTPISSVQWDVGRAFGTIGARVSGEQVEVTTYRADSYDGLTRKPSVEFGDSLEGDLVRRDFTVNSMALRVAGAHARRPDRWGRGPPRAAGCARPSTRA